MFDRIGPFGKRHQKVEADVVDLRRIADELRVVKESIAQMRAFIDAGHGVGKDDAMRLDRLEKRALELQEQLKRGR